MFAPVLCSLFYTFPPLFDKAEPSMAFAEQLSWHREWRMQAQSFVGVSLLSFDA
jgi:hypothetical protein